MDRIKKIVLIGHDVEGSKHVFDHIIDSFPDTEFHFVIALGFYYRKSFVQSIVKMLKESSFIFCFVKFIEMARYKIRGQTIEKACRSKKIPYFSTRDVNSEETCERIRSISPDLIVSLYTMQIYKNNLISIPKYGAINCHPSLLPHYRGLETFFWAMANGETKTGVSVFFLEEKIDHGKVLLQAEVPIEPSYSMFDLYLKLTEKGAQLLTKAIKSIDSGNFATTIPQGKGSYYPMPTSQSVRDFYKRGKRFF